MYGPQPSPYPGGSSSSGGDTTNALIAAILMTLCCNQICGIIAIVFTAMAMGQYGAEQDRYLRYAWTAMKVGLGITVAIIVLYFVIIGLVAGMA